MTKRMDRWVEGMEGQVDVEREGWLPNGADDGREAEEEDLYVWLTSYFERVGTSNEPHSI